MQTSLEPLPPDSADQNASRLRVNPARSDRYGSSDLADTWRSWLQTTTPVDIQQVEGMGAGIQADGLTMTYGDLKAVDNVSFEVRAGEFFGLLGPNGAGKTTALEMVEGLRKPKSGTVRIDGMDPGQRKPELMRRLGVQLQAASFFERLTAREQLDSFGALYGVAPGRTDEMLEHVGLVDKADIRTEDLSGG